MTEAIGTAGIRDLADCCNRTRTPRLYILVTERDATRQRDPVEQDVGVETPPQLHSRRHRRSMFPHRISAPRRSSEDPR
jgi:hypothetical protein